MAQHITPEYIKSLKPNEIFVFGSNLAGMHGGVTKFLRNGQLFILRDGKTFTVQGQEVR